MLTAMLYTANTMATAVEAMGLSLPGSSSTPAESPAKMRECAKAADAIKICMERNIKPRDMLTKKSFENAMVSLISFVLLLWPSSSPSTSTKPHE